jgi:hypothetical protein
MTSSLRNYLLGIFIASILCWAALILIIFNSNPYSGGKSIIILFFISLFFGSVGFLTLTGFYLRLLFSKNEIIYSHIVPSIRQAFLMSFCVVVLLALQILRLVNIWTGILLVLAVLSLEFFFRTRLRKVKKL